MSLYCTLLVTEVGPLCTTIASYPVRIQTMNNTKKVQRNLWWYRSCHIHNTTVLELQINSLL